MRLTALSGLNLRCVAEVELEDLDNTVILSGRNGAGKTSVLEGIHLLGMGRSFRTRSTREVLRRGEDVLRVVGRLQSDAADVDATVVGLERRGTDHRIRVNGKDVQRMSDLARLLPLMVIRPESHELISGGSEERRRILDWAVFHVKHDYADAHARYRRALAQRNRALRDAASSREIAAWSQDLARAASAVEQDRRAFISAAKVRLESTIHTLVGLAIGVQYRPGWDPETDFVSQLDARVAIDRQRGFTSVGPHRADLVFQETGRRARAVLSRGESKLLVLGALLSFVVEIQASTGVRPVILVDDLASELDAFSRERFFSALRELNSQAFITTVDAELIPSYVQQDATMFHVEQGQVRRVV